MTVYCQGDSKALISVTSYEGEGQTGIVTYSGKVGTPCHQDPLWLQPQSPAVWVWNSYYASPKENSDEYASFSAFFSAVQGQTFSLVVAADNRASITLNGQSVGTVTSFSSTNSFSLKARGGSNHLAFDCVNTPTGYTDPEDNPAGLYFIVSAERLCQASPPQQLTLNLEKDGIEVVESPDRPNCITVKNSSGVSKQICSTEGCNSPQFQVNCEPCCPPGTCEVECGGHTCCYNEQGYVIKRC